MTTRTWIDIARLFDTEIPEDAISYLMWNETAYPFSDVRTTVYQLWSAIRAGRNSVRRCSLCSYAEPYHRKNCPAAVPSGYSR